ncbi:hypothetical protein ElyMa_006885100 [Elysia marginata]|uniref:ShKT domain-containing protein n=1 Tax=Elysia marginata TaxID=1093978 RepID=A0AAV4JEP5_9GAST|nr:hypothetical protein ElyMa_006885100 [Elysia marginata]
MISTSLCLYGRTCLDAANIFLEEAATSNVCKDRPSHMRSCQLWAKRGFCRSNSSVKNVYCRQSCGTCDQTPGATGGQDARTPFFMQVSHPRCNLNAGAWHPSWRASRSQRGLWT